MDREKKYLRYQRQILLKEFGIPAQDKLLSAKVLVIGAGGLGCPALQYLAAAGIGYIGIVDFDVVELSNLHRQILYTTDDIGQPKAETAAKKIGAMNPEIEIKVFKERIQNHNALRIIRGFDLVIDGSDNFATRYLVNDACVILNKPLVYGAVLKFEGQVGVFNLADKTTKLKTNYRDLFPQPPIDSLSCNEVGVIGVLPGMIGSMQAAEAIKILTKIGTPLCNKIISYNALNNSFYEMEISPNENTGSLMPENEEAFMDFNYESFCDASSAGSQITTDEFDELRRNKKVTIIDVREMDEVPQIMGLHYLSIPMSGFERDISQLSTEHKIVLICQTGKRSMAALQIMKKHFPECEIFSLKGGIDAWQNIVISK